MASNGKIVFFFPSYATKEVTPPLALISLAGPLIKAGYDVRIIDTAVERDHIGVRNKKFGFPWKVYAYWGLQHLKGFSGRTAVLVKTLPLLSDHLPEWGRRDLMTVLA